VGSAIPHNTRTEANLLCIEVSVPCEFASRHIGRKRQKQGYTQKVI